MSRNQQATTPPDLAGDGDVEKSGVEDHTPVKLFRPRVFAMVLLVSLGGMIFGYGML